MQYIKRIFLYERKGYILLEHDYMCGFIKIVSINSNIPEFIFEQNIIKKINTGDNKTKVEFHIVGYGSYEPTSYIQINAKILIHNRNSLLINIINKPIMYFREKIEKINLFNDFKSVMSLKINSSIRIVVNNYEKVYDKIFEQNFIDFTNNDFVEGFTWWKMFCNKTDGLLCCENIYTIIDSNNDLIDVEIRGNKKLT